jgi:hypothetical protein
LNGAKWATTHVGGRVETEQSNGIRHDRPPWHRQQMASWRKAWSLLGRSEQDALHLIRMCANGAFSEWQSVNARVVGDDTRPHCPATMWAREYCRTGSGRVYLEGRLACPEVQPGGEEQAVCRAVHMGVPDTRQLRRWHPSHQQRRG